MNTAILTRNQDRTKQTTGKLEAFDEDGNKLFECVTMELPDKSNEPRVSCIPDGEYIVTMTHSPKYNRDMYLVKDVPNRSGIRIHSANYWYDLLGCIGLGSGYSDLNSDGLPDIVNSRNTIKEFEEVMGGEDFRLIIHNT